VQGDVAGGLATILGCDNLQAPARCQAGNKVCVHRQPMESQAWPKTNVCARVPTPQQRVSPSWQRVAAAPSSAPVRGAGRVPTTPHTEPVPRRSDGTEACTQPETCRRRADHCACGERLSYVRAGALSDHPGSTPARCRPHWRHLPTPPTPPPSCRRYCCQSTAAAAQHPSRHQQTAVVCRGVAPQAPRPSQFLSPHHQ
jgi:hypothetical protein